MNRFSNFVTGLCFLLVFLAGCNTSPQWINSFNRQGSSLERSILQMIIDNDGNLWLVAYNGHFYGFEQKSSDWVPHFSTGEDPLGSAQSLGAGRNGSIWIGTSKGLGQFLPANNQWLTYGVENGLANEDVRAILEDNTGTLWAGTGGSGMFVSMDSGGTWRHLTIEDGYSNFTVRTIFQDSQNHVWIAGNALYRYDPDRQKWLTYTDGDERFNELTNKWELPPLSTRVLEDDFVYAIWEDKKGILWFGTLSAGIMRYDPGSDKWENFTVANGLVNNTVKSINGDFAGNVWFGTDEGASRFNPATSEWTSFNSEDGFTDYSVTSIVTDQTNRLWFSTFGDGVFTYHLNE